MQSGWLSPEINRQFPQYSLQLLGRRCCTYASWRLSTIGYPLLIFSILRSITPETLGYSPQRREYHTHEGRLKGNLGLISLSSASAARFWCQLFSWGRWWVLWYYRAWSLFLDCILYRRSWECRERNQITASYGTLFAKQFYAAALFPSPVLEHGNLILGFGCLSMLLERLSICVPMTSC